MYDLSMYTFERVLKRKHEIMKIGGESGKALVAYAAKLKEDYDNGKDVNVDDLFFEGQYSAWVSANDR